ncbi:MAG: InlB B-repeat-containing protein, partial [Bacteroidales bacterium]|nr:InlB B-repeat-containing protein [Bacteroidales bacterium]
MKKFYSVRLQKFCCLLSVMLLVLGAHFHAAGQHNVYAVVPSGDDARLKVTFVQANGNTTSMYVKKADISNGQLNTILYNPLSGTFGSDVFFRGWTTDPDYDATDIANAMTMADVRSAVTDSLNAYNSSHPLTDGHEVTFYAMLFKAYNVTYYNGKSATPGNNGAVLGVDQVLYRADATSPNMSYTVNMGFSTDTSTAFFMGWHVVDGTSNVQGHSDGRIYPNDTVIQLNGNVSFSVDVAQGHWLVFNENGKGATYNAPRFLQTNETTTEPAQPTRLGYGFDGWYTDAACTAGSEFEFGSTLTENTTIYAKWKPLTEANYTVLIWKQNIAGTGYDFVESVTIENATVGSTPNAVNASGVVTGASYAGETGFSFSNTDQASQTVAPEGNTVVNVYYDRNTITLNFYTWRAAYTEYTYTQATGNGGTQYGTENGVDYFPLIRILGVWWRVDQLDWPYTGPRYTRTEINYPAVWESYQTMSGLYGSRLEDNGYTWPTDYDWYNDHNNSGGGSGTRTTFYDAFMIPSGASSQDFYGDSPSSGRTVIFYKQDSSGNGYEESDRVNTSGGSFNISDKYSGFTAYQYRSDNGQWQNVGTYNPNTGYYGSAVSYTNTLYIRYNRDTYTLNFMDGVYVNGNGAPIQEDNHGQWNEVEGITFGANIASYNSSGVDYYVPENPNAAYIFEGWYLDDACSRPCTFNTMPEGGLTVYAKWRQKEYRVFLHPNAGTDPSLTWTADGADEPEMNFRVAYGGTVSAPTGLRNDYKFVGWYRDPDLTLLFNPDAFPMNDNVTTPYDKTVDMTDDMDKWGNITNPPGTNSDATGYNGGDRFWVTQKFDLYAKWSAELDGAEGIGLVYNANGGTNAPTDSKLYTDMAQAIAVGAPTPPAGKVFSHWEVQQCSGGTSYVSSGVTTLDGGAFVVKKDDACQEELEGSTPQNHRYSYTVQLKAVYVDVETPSQTSIVWLLNDGSGDTVRTDGLGTGAYPTLAINEAVFIPAAPTRTGYTFKGWYRLSVSAESTPQDVVLQCNPNFLYYNSIIYYKNAACGEADTASRVFADNVSPYYYLYAIWEPEVEIDFPRTFCLNETEGITLPTAASANNDVTLTWTYDNSPVTEVNTTAEVTDAVYTYTTSDGCVEDTIHVTVRDGATLEIVDPGVLCSTLEDGSKTVTANITGAPSDYDIAWIYRGSSSEVQHYEASTTSVTFDANVVPDEGCVGTYRLYLAYNDGICVKIDSIDILVSVNTDWMSEFADSAKTVECVSEVVAPTLPEITDNCGNAITFTEKTIPSAADIAAAACGGEVSYVYEAKDCTDSASHKKEWRYTYTVTPPTLSFEGTITNIENVDACYSEDLASQLKTNAQVKAMYSSNCSRTITVDSVDAVIKSDNCDWKITRTFTITDGCNTETKSQSVSGKDDTSPVANTVEITATSIQCAADTTSAVSDTTALGQLGFHFTDCNNINTAVSVQSNAFSGSVCNGSRTTVYRVSDECGNYVDVTYIQPVKDETSPVANT